MSSRSNATKTKRSDRADYGFARARDVAYDAVMELWAKRQAEGVTQAAVARALGRDPGWVSKQLRGPGNWTLRTFGELVEALDGEAEIYAYPLESPATTPSNYDAYLGYGESPIVSASASGVLVVRGFNRAGEPTSPAPSKQPIKVSF